MGRVVTTRACVCWYYYQFMLKVTMVINLLEFCLGTWFESSGPQHI